MSKKVDATFLAGNDFYKTNGERGVFNTEGPSLTRQEFAEECDINTLMKRYEGHVIGGPGGLGMHQDQQMWYADFTALPSSLLEYHRFMDDAQRSFMMLPAAVRKEFENDPVRFVEYASDPNSLDQMREWGLAPPAKKEDAPMRVEVVNPAPPTDEGKAAAK